MENRKKGCEDNITCGTLEGCENHPDPKNCENIMKAQIQAKYGVSGKDLDLREPPMRRMAAKLIWQHYRQALDREFLVSLIDRPHFTSNFLHNFYTKFLLFYTKF
mgnify:CR=1 FL=1